MASPLAVAFVTSPTHAPASPHSHPHPHPQTHTLTPLTPHPPPCRSVVVLNDIHIDIMDYISPASCPDVQFRSMWAEFEWENKVAVNTAITEPLAFLDHIIVSTNMVGVPPGC